MAMKFGQGQPELIESILKTLHRWDFAASADGTVWIRPRQTTVTLYDLCNLMKRVHLAFQSRPPRRLVFCFENAEATDQAWSVFLKLFTACARLMQIRCSVIRTFAPGGGAADPVMQCIMRAGDRSPRAGGQGGTDWP